MLPTAPKPSDDDLLEMPIFDLNIAKLSATVTMLSPTGRTAAADLTVLVTSIKDFLKLTLVDIWSLAPVLAEETMPVQQIEIDTGAKVTTISDHTLTDIPTETTTDNITAMDVVPPAPAIDPSIYLATPVALPSPQ
uniref:Uncharacterized protein n=1 Tax=Romanomermis culicivorax TaxID=13658 RepID=A0A915K0Y6_ROMCU